jgi:hypothetical protein
MEIKFRSSLRFDKSTTSSEGKNICHGVQFVSINFTFSVIIENLNDQYKKQRLILSFLTSLTNLPAQATILEMNKFQPTTNSHTFIRTISLLERLCHFYFIPTIQREAG